MRLLACLSAIVLLAAAGCTNSGARRAFFGVPIGDAHKIVFFISDRSGSLKCSPEFVQYEMKRCLEQLKEEDLFDVLFLTSGMPPEMPSKSLVPATEKNKQLASEFIYSIFVAGETDPLNFLKRAFELKPEIIFLLTDGDFDCEVPDLCKRLNPEKKVKVHTICYLYDIGEEVLKQIAADSGGTYKFVSEADLEKLSQP